MNIIICSVSLESIPLNNCLHLYVRVKCEKSENLLCFCFIRIQVRKQMNAIVIDKQKTKFFFESYTKIK